MSEGDTDPDLAALVAQLRTAWESGTPISVEELLQRRGNPKLPDNALLELIYTEFLARRDFGQSLPENEYASRFPALADRLRRLFALHRELGDPARTLATAVGNVELTAAFTPGSTQPPTNIASDVSRRPPPVGARVRYLGDYELLDELARGGMGVVYKARQVNLNRIVAVKMILAGQFAGEEDVRRFRTEAEAAAHLDHPHIVPIFEVGQHEGLHYFSMGFVEGWPLSARIAEGYLPVQEAAALLTKISEAVHYAHQKGVIHRDLKPGNILVDRAGEPRITDFGLAKRTDAASESTGTGQVMGTPGYMPPEQALGHARLVRETADVYALGAVLYAMLTGRAPFVADTTVDTLRQVVEREPIAPRQLNPSIPIDLETICLKCLEKSSIKRYQTAQEVADELRRFREGKPIIARPVGPMARAWRWCKRNRAVAILLGAVAASLIIGTIVSTFFAFEADRRADENDKLAKSESAAKSDAQARGEELRKSLSKRYVQAGFDRLEANPNESFAWWVKALELDQGDLERERLHRIRLGLLWRQMPRLTGMFVHDAPVTCIDWSPDGTRLVTASYDGTARQWDYASRRPIGEPMRHDGYVYAARYSPDGKSIATGGEDATLRVWDGETTKTVAGPFRHRIEVGDVQFSPDGRRLATTVMPHHEIYFDALPPGVQPPNRSRHPRDKSLPGASVWNLSTGEHVELNKTGREFRASLMRFLPGDESKLLAVDHSNSTMIVCDAKTGIGAGEPIRARGGGKVRAIALSEDSNVIANIGLTRNMDRSRSFTRSLTSWKLPSQEQTGIGVGTGQWDSSRDAWELARMPAAGAVWWRPPDRTPTVFDDLLFSRRRPLAPLEASMVLKHYIPAHSSSHRDWLIRSQREVIPYALRFAPRYGVLAFAGSDEYVRTWDLATLAPDGVFISHNSGASIVDATWLADGRSLAVLSGDGSVVVWDSLADQVSPPGPLIEMFEARGLRILRDGRIAVVGDAIEFLDPLATRLAGSRLVADEPTAAVELPADEGRLVQRLGGIGPPSVRTDPKVVVRELATGAISWPAAKLARDESPMVVSREGTFILAEINTIGNLETRDVSTGDRRYPSVTHPAPILAITTGNSNEGVTLCVDGGVRCFEIDSGKLRWQKFDAANPSILVASPDGASVAVGGDGQIRVYQLETGNELFAARLPTRVDLLAFSPNGKMLVGATSDLWQMFDFSSETRAIVGKAVLWDLASATELAKLPAHGVIERLMFSSDSARLVIKRQSDIQIWNLKEDSRSTNELSLLARCLFPQTMDEGSPGAETPVAELKQGWDEATTADPDIPLVDANERERWMQLELNSSRRVSSLDLDDWKELTERRQNQWTTRHRRAVELDRRGYLAEAGQIAQDELLNGFASEPVIEIAATTAVTRATTVEIERITQAIERAPESPWPLFCRALLYESRVQFLQAITDARAGRRWFDAPSLAAIEARCLAELGNLDEALAVCRSKYSNAPLGREMDEIRLWALAKGDRPDLFNSAIKDAAIRSLERGVPLPFTLHHDKRVFAAGPAYPIPFPPPFYSRFTSSTRRYRRYDFDVEGAYAFRRGEMPRAEELLRQAVNADMGKTDPVRRLHLVLTLLATGKRDEANAVINEAKAIRDRRVAAMKDFDPATLAPDQPPPEGLWWPWPERMQTEALLEECEEKLKESGGAP